MLMYFSFIAKKLSLNKDWLGKNRERKMEKSCPHREEMIKIYILDNVCTLCYNVIEKKIHD